jgi:hypothetical protein
MTIDTTWTCRAALALAITVLASCAEPGAPGPEPGAGDRALAASLDDEARRYADDMVLFRARRAAYEQTGAIPTVPPSLSANPHDPEYVFLRYVHIGTEAERAAYEARLEAQGAPEPSAEERADYEITFEQDVSGGFAGVYVNDAGEMWGHRPSNIVERLRALRAARGNPDARTVQASAIVPDTTGTVSVAVQAVGIIGADNRELRSALSGDSMTSYPWRAFGALVRNGQGTSEVPDVHCSATKVGERYLLTAGHCSFDADGGKGSLFPTDWWPGADGLAKKISGSDPSPNGKKNILWYYYSKKFVDKGWWSRDYAVLVLYDNTSSCSLGSLGYRVDNSLLGQSTWNFGYPGEQRACAASPDGDGRCGGSMWGSSSFITRTEVPYIFYKHDTDHGQSGSAVYDFNGGNRQIVGHAVSTYSAIENRGIKMRNRVFDIIDTARDDHPSSVCHY